MTLKKVNYKEEEFLTFDGQLMVKLKAIEDKIRGQFQTPGKHYTVAELLDHSGSKFFKLWDEKEFPAYQKVTKKKEVKEYRGLYVFATYRDGRLDFDYVGISRGIRQRFQWHVAGTIRNHATWAWLMLKHENKVGPNPDAETIKESLSAKQKEFIHHCLFTFVPIESDMMLHLAEIYCANQLRARWNSFRTH